MAGILEKQLTFALEKVYGASCSLENPDREGIMNTLKMTISKIQSKQSKIGSAKDFSVEQFLAGKIVCDTKAELMSDSEEGASEKDVTVQPYYPIPVALSVSLVIKLGITKNFVKLFLSEDITFQVKYMNKLTSLTSTGEDDILKILFSLWIELLHPWSWRSILQSANDLPQRGADIIIAFLESMEKGTSHYISKVESFETHKEELEEIIATLKSSAMNFLKAAPIRRCLLKNVKGISVSESTGSECIGDDLVNVKGSNCTDEAEGGNLETQDVDLQEHMCTLKCLFHMLTDFEQHVKTEDLMMQYYYSTLYIPTVVTLEDALKFRSGIQNPTSAESDTFSKVLDIVAVITASACHGYKGIMDQLDLSELLSLLSSDRLIIWESFSKRNLSDSEEKYVLDLLEHDESLPCRLGSLLECLEIVKSTYLNREVDERKFKFWNKIYLCLIKHSSIDSVNEVLRVLSTEYDTQDGSVFLNSLDNKAENDQVLQSSRLLLNRMTAETTDLMLQLSHLALQGPYDVLKLVLRRGVTSMAEAKLCVQILDFIWGLKYFEVPQADGKPAVLDIVEKIWAEQTAIQKDAAVAVICGITTSQWHPVHPLKILCHHVVPQLSQCQARQSYDSFTLGVMENFSSLDRSAWLHDLESVNGLCAAFCSCIVHCVQLLKEGQGSALPTEWKQTLKFSVFKMQKVFGEVLEAHREKWQDIFDILQSTVDLNDPGQSIYLSELLCAIGRQDEVLLPQELGSIDSQVALELTNAPPSLLISLLQVVCMNGSLRESLCGRLTSSGEIDLGDLIYAVAEVCPLVGEEEMESLVGTLHRILLFAEKEKLKSILPKWFTWETSKAASNLLLRAAIVSVVAHAAVYMLIEKKDAVSETEICRKYAQAVKIAFIDHLAVDDLHAEITCTFLLAALQQSFQVSSHVTGSSHENEVLCIELVNLYLETSKNCKSKEQSITLCGCLHRLVKNTPKLNYRSILIQRITTCMTNL